MPRRSRTIAAVVVPVLAAGALAAAGSAAAAGASRLHRGVNVITGGTTVVRIAPSAQGVFTAAQVTVSPFGTTTASGWTYTMPITRGRLVYRPARRARKGKHGAKARRATLTGSLQHAGAGLTLARTGGFSVTTTDYHVGFEAPRSGSFDGQPGISPQRLEIGRLRAVAVAKGGAAIAAQVWLTPEAADATTAGLGTQFPGDGALLATLTVRPEG
jgi:hypothetical protein